MGSCRHGIDWEIGEEIGKEWGMEEVGINVFLVKGRKDSVLVWWRKNELNKGGWKEGDVHRTLHDWLSNRL